MGDIYGSRGLLGVAALMGALAKKRKAYFSFHFDDIMRVNNVRQAWKIDHPDAPKMRSFYDSSLWESRQLDSPESLKSLIRNGVEHTSAICVLVGSKTWLRRWVRYEIARAVIDRRGLLAVHLNSLRHHETLLPDPWGPNPLAYMAVGKVQSNSWTVPQYYLFELNTQGWVRYQDYTLAVDLPRYLADPAAGYVTPLSAGTSVYDYVSQMGHKNIGAWIDQAAQQVASVPMRIRGLGPVTAPPPKRPGLEPPPDIGGIRGLAERVCAPLPGFLPPVGSAPRSVLGAPLPVLETPPDIGGPPRSAFGAAPRTLAGLGVPAEPGPSAPLSLIAGLGRFRHGLGSLDAPSPSRVPPVGSPPGSPFSAPTDSLTETFRRHLGMLAGPWPRPALPL